MENCTHCKTKQNKMKCERWHCLHGTELFEKLLSQDKCLYPNIDTLDSNSLKLQYLLFHASDNITGWNRKEVFKHFRQVLSLESFFMDIRLSKTEEKNFVSYTR